MTLRNRWEKACSSHTTWMDRIATMAEHLGVGMEDTVRTLLRNKLVSTSDLLALQEEYESHRSQTVREFSSAVGIKEINTSVSSDAQDLIDNYLLSGEMSVDRIFEA